MKFASSLRDQATIWTISAFLTGALAAWAWMSSQASWNAYLDHAFATGLELFETLDKTAPSPPGIEVSFLAPAQSRLADRGAFTQLSGAPSPVFVTRVSAGEGKPRNSSPQTLSLVILSPDFRYSVAAIEPANGRAPSVFLGNVARLLANYCSDPVVLAKFGSQGWREITGSQIWGCAAAPADLRLGSAVLALLSLFFLIGRAAETSSRFRDFASKLRQRGRLGGPDMYDVQGPDELRETVDAVNGYLSMERELLSRRALFLSGISHDLGTPATRLRLRTTLIDDDDLRGKLEADIDSMTLMIESVLTYTQSELNAEKQRKISLTSLLEAIVADYQDMARPVTFHNIPPTEFEVGKTVFDPNAGRHHVTLPHPHGILLSARPVSLRRAISNLIDNALKYGRRAHVSLEANSETARIIVEDEGGDGAKEAIETLVGPFQRGKNAKLSDGVGLGLTIVSAIAEQHGGALSFIQSARGLKAIIEIAR